MKGVKGTRRNEADKYFFVDGKYWYYFSHDVRAMQKAYYKGNVTYYYTPAHSHIEFDPSTTLMLVTYKLYLPEKRKLTDDDEYEIKSRIKKVFVEMGYEKKRIIVQGVSYAGMFLSSIFCIGLPLPTEEQVKTMEGRLHEEIEIKR